MIQASARAYAYPGGSRIQFPDIDVQQGAVVVMSGPSGCGKSTWLALGAGLVQANTGQSAFASMHLARPAAHVAA